MSTALCSWFVQRYVIRYAAPLSPPPSNLRSNGRHHRMPRPLRTLSAKYRCEGRGISGRVSDLCLSGSRGEDRGYYYPREVDFDEALDTCRWNRTPLRSTNDPYDKYATRSSHTLTAVGSVCIAVRIPSLIAVNRFIRVVPFVVSTAAELNGFSSCC